MAVRTRSAPAVSRAIDFLLARQGSDGLWREFHTLAGEGADWPTGFIGGALVSAGAERGSLRRAADTLAATQHDDGGWGYHAGVPSDADSTAWVLLFLSALGGREECVERGVACLVRHQDRESGGVPTYLEGGPIRRYMRLPRQVRVDGWRRAHLEVTAAAGRAAAAVRGARNDCVRAAWEYVRERQRENGSWPAYWWSSPYFSTLQAVELAALVGDRAAISRATVWAIGEQNADGGWGTPTSAFSTALATAILLRTGRRRSELARAVARLEELQDADGGWPSHAALRIPPPDVSEPDNHRAWRVNRLGTGVIVHDGQRLFTSATCVAALARFRDR
jgi:squalene-hopene/tetraprenyl-beta-curcumene cyclase/sporulenol synthase